MTSKAESTWVPTKRKNDNDKRKARAARIARIIKTHWLIQKYGSSKDDIAMIAEILKVSKHTISKDRMVLRCIYQALGTKSLDCPPVQKRSAS